MQDEEQSNNIIVNVCTCVQPAVEEGVVAGGAHGEHVGDEEGDVEILPTI